MSRFITVHLPPPGGTAVLDSERIIAAHSVGGGAVVQLTEGGQYEVTETVDDLAALLAAAPVRSQPTEPTL